MSGPTPSREEPALYLLVLRCQTGDASAFARLMEQFGGRTLAHLRRILGDDAEDVQQEVWLAVYRNLSGLSNPGAFRTWLFQTTRHRAIDFLRARKRQQELVDDSAREAAGETVRDMPYAAFNQSEVMPAMQALSPILREVLLLRYDEGLSYAEAAVVLGCSVGTVRSRLHHAKRNLQEVIERRRSAGDQAR
jgi:RNA polymerase sigma-70 factor (ECF subfamily)